MGWLQRLFGVQKPSANSRQQAPQARTNVAAQAPQARTNATTQSTQAAAQAVPPERVGLNGEYDQSGLAKRVALAFDESSDLDDIDTLYVAQTGSTVVLKGKVPNQQVLSRMVSVARNVDGATAVETDQVTIG